MCVKHCTGVAGKSDFFFFGGIFFQIAWICVDCNMGSGCLLFWVYRDIIAWAALEMVGIHDILLRACNQTVPL